MVLILNVRANNRQMLTVSGTDALPLILLRTLWGIGIVTSPNSTGNPGLARLRTRLR